MTNDKRPSGDPMTPPPADPVPLELGAPEAYIGHDRHPVWNRHQVTRQATDYGDSRERAGLARGVAEERARVVGWLEEARAFFARGEGILEEDEIARRVNVAALGNVIAAITRGDHERTPDA